MKKEKQARRENIATENKNKPQNPGEGSPQALSPFADFQTKSFSLMEWIASLRRHARSEKQRAIFGVLDRQVAELILAALKLPQQAQTAMNTPGAAKEDGSRTASSPSSQPQPSAATEKRAHLDFMFEMEDAVATAAGMLHLTSQELSRRITDERGQKASDIVTGIEFACADSANELRRCFNLMCCAQ